MAITSDLSEQIKANRGIGREFPVIVTLGSSADLAVLRLRGVEPTFVYANIPGFAARLTGDQIEAIATLPQVKMIELDQEAWALDPR